MYRQAIALSVGLSCYLATAWPQASSSALMPDQLVEAAVSKNRGFLALKQRIAEAQGLLRQAGVGPAPNVDISGLAGQPFGNAGEDDFSLTYAHTFETFGKRSKRIAVAQKEVTLAEAEFADRRRVLAFDIKNRYAEAASEQKKLEIFEHLLGLNRDYLRLTEVRVEKGDEAPLEADLLRVELSRYQAQRILSEGRLRSAALELKAALDIPGTQSLTLASSLAPPRFPDDLQRLKMLALTNRPDLRALRIAEEQTVGQTVLARADAKPNLTVSGQYSHTDTAFDQYGLTQSGAVTPLRAHNDLIGLGISIPLTSARRNRGNIEAAVARQAEAKLRREYLESTIPTQVEAAFRRWRAAQEAVAVFSKGVIDQSEKNLNVMRQAYNLGELRLLDVLNEQRRLLDTELSYVDAQTELFRAYTELEQLIGGSLQ
jgi:outer membrane protein, heavy metal efflux system